VMKQNPGSMPLTIPPLPIPADQYNLRFTFKDDQGVVYANTPYTAVLPNGVTVQGMTDEQGQTEILQASNEEDVKIHLHVD